MSVPECPSVETLRWMRYTIDEAVNVYLMSPDEMLSMQSSGVLMSEETHQPFDLERFTRLRAFSSITQEDLTKVGAFLTVRRREPEWSARQKLVGLWSTFGEHSNYTQRHYTKADLVGSSIWEGMYANGDPGQAAAALEEYVVSILTHQAGVTMELAEERRQSIRAVANTMWFWGKGSRYLAPESLFWRVPEEARNRQLWTDKEAYGPLTLLDAGERNQAHERLVSVLTLYGLQNMDRYWGPSS